MSEASENTVDLRTPAEFLEDNYVHQIRQTIDAYSPSNIVLGEALQNSIDAVCDCRREGRGEISVEIDLDSDTVTVSDNGIGFPPDLSLLYLGGTTKQVGSSKGKTGVGIKVAMFSSNYFRIRSNNGDRAWIAELSGAYTFEELASLPVPQTIPDDLNPLPHQGTQVRYTFPTVTNDENLLDRFIGEMVNACLPQGVETGSGRSIVELKTDFPSPFAALLSSFLRRRSYVGDVLAAMNKQPRRQWVGHGCAISQRLGGKGSPTLFFQGL